MLILQAPPPIQGKLCKTIVEAMRKGEQMYARRSTPVESNQYFVSSMHQETNQGEILNSSGAHLAQTKDALCQNGFLKAPSKQVINSAIGEFIDCTSNSVMAIGVCTVCAQETNRRDLTAQQLELFPGRQHLQPEVPHPGHDIFNGMLLHPAGVIDTGNTNVCMECFRALKSDKIPTFALANGLWIGTVPHELAYLTLPEQLLIAKYFPATYIIKLYPKKKGACLWDIQRIEGECVHIPT